MSLHDETQDALLARDGDAPLAESVEHHLVECAECRGFADALGAVDSGLLALEPIELPPQLLERTLEAAQAQPATVEPTLGVWGLLAATFAAVFSGLWAMLRLLVAPLSNRRVRIGFAVAVPALGALALFFGVGSVMMLGSDAESVVASPTPSTLDWGEEASEMDGELSDSLSDSNGDFWNADEDGRVVAEPTETGLAEREVVNGWEDDGDVVASDQPSSARLDNSLARNERSPVGGQGQLEGLRQGLGRDRVALVDEEDELEVATRSTSRTTVDLPPRDIDRQQADDGIRPGTYEVRLAERGYADRTRTLEPSQATPGLMPMGGEAPQGQTGGAIVDGRFGYRQPVSEANAEVGFTTATEHRRDEGRDLAQRRSQLMTLPTTGLTFQSARGYWANTYVPGDPAIRTLRRQLADQPGATQLAELAQPADPHLDPPRQGALAMRVAADRTEVEGQTRVLLSVALRGAAQRAGRRPTLRTQVVLDLRQPLDSQGQARVRALLTSLSRSRDGADRVGVIVAGPHGGELLPLGRLRFGEVSVALRRAFEQPQGENVTLTAAVERAVTSIGQLDDDASPLGTSLVLLVSPQLSDGDARAVARVAHTGTLAGVTTTSVGLGDAASLDALERIALAGHGRRRVLSEPRDATGLVRAEMTSVSRVVARAVRLRVRLGEGVQLVDVLGSRRLGEAAAQRVRDSEQAIDRALASRLGITSDRGEDEDGIQIVVPVFYADDAHTVLFDLVVPGPGAVADVQVRFKDLLRLGNGTLTDRLSLGRGSSAPGPQQRAVLIERLGFELSTALRAAARQVERGQIGPANATLVSARARIDQVRAALPELASEPSLARDQNLCDRFRTALGGGTVAPDSMAGSLRYAAHRRLFGDPLGLGGAD